MIVRLPIYDGIKVIRAAHVEAGCFSALQEKPDGIDIVQKFRVDSKKLLEDFEAQWIALCDGDETELTDWGNRMKMINSKFNELDRQLAVRDNPRLFDWETVGECMGLINAFRVAVEQVLNHNEALKKAA